jgi:hypothetical protein
MSFARTGLGGSFVALGLVCALSGCSAGSPQEPVGEATSGLTANDKVAFDYFLGKGLANFQAAGIVGNLDQESGMDPMAIEPGGPGRGIAQWSVGGRWDSDPNDNAKSYAGTQGKSVWSLSLQLDFIWYELTTFPHYGLAGLRQSTNVADATIVFERDFEGCGTCLESQRISYAKAALNAYGSDSVDAGPHPEDAGPDAAHDDGGAPDGHTHPSGDSGSPPPGDHDAGRVGDKPADPGSANAAGDGANVGESANGCSAAGAHGYDADAWLCIASLVFILRRRRTEYL